MEAGAFERVRRTGCRRRTGLSPTTGSARSARVSRWAPTASEGGLRNRGGDDLRQALRLASILSVVTILGGTLRTVSVAMSRLAASNMLAAASPPDTPLHDVTPGDVGYTAIAPGAGGVEQFELAKQARSPMLVGCLSILCSHASSYQFAPGSFSVSSCSFSSAAALLFQDRMTGSRRLAVALAIRKCRQAPRAPAACTA
jgi:hypothetical protein